MLALAIGAAPALARDAAPPPASKGARPADALLVQLDSLQHAVDDPALSPAARSAQALQADSLRARLIELAPGDPRAPTWLVDRAVFALAQLTETDTDLSVLVGLPSAEQRSRAAQAAHAALALLDRAQSTAQAAVAALETELLTSPGAGDTAEASIARLVEVEQSQRIPLYTALAKTLLAACSFNDQEKASAAAGAVRAMESLRVRTPALEAARDTLAALAVLNASSALNDRAIGAIRTKLNSVLGASAAEPATRTRARLGLLAAGVGEPTPGASWGGRLIEHEARVRAAIGGSGPSAPRRVNALAGAALDLVNLVAEPVLENDLGGLSPALVRDARRALVYAKVAPVVDSKAPPASMPAELLFARGVTMLRESAPSFPQAEPLLRHVADRLDATADLRADALWELAAAYDKHGVGAPQAVAALHRAVRELPATARAPDAARALAQRLAPDFARLASPEGQAAGVSGIRPEYLDALRLLAHTPGEGRFAGDLVRAELLAEPARVSPGALHAALRTHAAMPDGPARAAAKGAIVYALPRAAAALSTLEPEQRAALRAEAFEFLGAHAPEHRDAAALLFGEALLRAGDPDALPLLESARSSAIDVPGSPEAARVRLGLARALRAAGRVGDAAAPLREIIAQFEKAPGESGRDAPYWEAWCSLLELSVEKDEFPSRLADLRAHLSRLELIDPSLGGSSLASRFARLKALAKPAPSVQAPTPAP